ncbi:MAG TPA: DUF523 domain-containing protein [Chromatiales bacterium]|nr:DUF523 domain-containing protein [Thiotrichales bacterium]HIP69290.1 DUF523 domain-containing protein [Chromatiales bacterium]
MKMTHTPEKIKIGISSCLLGNEVRYDGGHKRDANVIDELGKYFDFVAFCPEVETGMGVPRKPVHLVRRGKEILALQVDNHARDFTRQLKVFSHDTHRKISELCGFILKENSPSCGMQSVRVYQDNAVDEMLDREGEGIFARSLKKQFPRLPLEEEDGLHDPVLRKNFVECVFAYHQSMRKC